MTEEEIRELNAVLYRPLRNDYPADIFPQVFCRPTNLGNGDTFFSVELIAIFINTYWEQCKKIAKKLQGKTFAQTMSNIHFFAYSHFQYAADWRLQKLRSPACSWRQREKGIDCKSYTILVGAILKCLGINFYIRQIKQLMSARPDKYTHVYIVVPIDQKNNDLEKGYYVIDGTIPTMTEIPLIETSDLLVMNHIGLNGRLPRKNYLIGLKANHSSIGGNFGTSTIGGGTSSFSLSTPMPSTNTFSKMNGWDKANTIVGMLGNFTGSISNLVLATKGINGNTQGVNLPDSVVTKADLVSYIQTLGQQNTQQANNDMMMLFLAMQQQKKTDYTPYLIGGGVLVAAIVAVVLLKDDKKK